MGRKKKSAAGKPKVHTELEGLDIHINEFGEIVTSYNVNNINEFLNKNVKDKKLIEREQTLKKQHAKRKKKK